MHKIRWALSAITLVGVSLFGTAQAQAKCASSYISLTPAAGTKELPRNTILLLNAFGRSRVGILDMLKGAALVHRGHQVGLNAKLLPSSQHSMRMSYVLLQPKGLLRANSTYLLKLKGKRPTHINRYLWKKLTQYRLTTSANIDKAPPTGIPLVKKAVYRTRRFGCGPSRSIQLTLTGTKDTHSPFLRYLFKVKVQTQGKTRHYNILSSGPSFGHGMCSGNFARWQTGAYTLTVTPVDLAGNRGKSSDPVTVKVP